MQKKSRNPKAQTWMSIKMHKMIPWMKCNKGEEMLGTTGATSARIGATIAGGEVRENCDDNDDDPNKKNDFNPNDKPHE